VARAQGILLDPERVDATVAHAAEHLGTLRTSMLQDVERSGRLEHDAINGAVVRFGEAVAVPTPLHRAFVALLSALTAPEH
jgi:2-dehydropantoate 2-reductase